MEQDDASSMISSHKLMRKSSAHILLETSDSNDTVCYAHIHANKRAKLDVNEAASSAKFKGVVPQQNGHWGAQIYANHQRIWLGTFKSEKVAAMAYDSAAIKLRSGDTHRNFPWTSLTLQEPHFQNHYTTEAILNMIKDGSYPSKFADFLGSQSKSKQIDMISSVTQVRVHGDAQFLCKQLFQKELTPSDVGKLNRLVIPKKYAVKYFPYICENAEDNVVDDIELVFYDKVMKSWKFRYCYWRSSQSFVFTRGWNRFVKEKNLKANDVVTFYSCECNEKSGQAFCLIDVTHNEDHIDPKKKCVDDDRQQVDQLEHNSMGHNSSCKFDKAAGDHQCKYKEADVQHEEKGFRLFGVRIN
ncbi:hypothetical protein FNV43_RR03037 [Rhamnella rubrinervis]|uniref:Uncharacterized protein n=1 Tax=Rhamnella rubrinervis TaxID=2594499 RepID=A0A8K0HI44_9ROSA|nr:hypothetical protein FNV43_RR03037 [Rhamnella rubrinervis]